MADNLSKEDRSKNMKAIRSAHTLLEDRITKALWRQGIRIRKNVKNLKGKPDIAVKKYKIVVFIDSCFWHGCFLHGNKPKSNESYWLPKLERNRQRDLEVNEHYQKAGWRILRIWEHDIKNNFDGALNQIVRFIHDAKNNKLVQKSNEKSNDTPNGSPKI